MYKDKRILCIIPARGGSKRLPGKNSMPLHGKPLIGYAIVAAKNSAYIDRTIVTTDDEHIARVARDQGADVPFMRPAELATDSASTLPVLQHAVRALEEGGEHYDIIVLVQPTVPGIETGDIDAAIEKLAESGANSCISVCKISDPPEWMYRRKEDGMLTKYSEASPTLSQDLEELYRVNGAVYVTRYRTLMTDNVIVDQKSCTSVLMPRERSVDIDTPMDFAIAEVLLNR